MEEEIRNLFIAYLEGKVSPVDENKLEEYLKDNPALVKEFGQYKKLWELTKVAGRFDKSHVEKKWAILKRKISDEKEKERFFYIFRYNISRYAAVFILGILFSILANYLLQNAKKDDLAFHSVSAPVGATSELVLPDGSEILLNAGSTIRYSEKFGEKERELFLSGEAYFNVADDASKPFLVNASDLTIKAYGTEFNVKAYPEDKRVEATLVEGLIGILGTTDNKRKSREIFLKPDQRLVYNPFVYRDEPREGARSRFLIVKGIDTQKYTIWMEGSLYVNSETLIALSRSLERKYNVEFHFEDEGIEQLRFTGLLENETIEQIMEAISMAAHIDCQVKGREVYLKNKKIDTN